MCTGLWLPAALQRALPERLHASGWDLILRRQLSRHMKDTEEEAVDIWVVSSQQVGGIGDQRPHPSLRRTGQGGAQPIVAVVQLPVGLPDDKMQAVKADTAQDFHD